MTCAPLAPRRRHAAGMLLLTLLLAGALGLAAQKNAERSVHGVVMNARDQPVSSALVYLKNTRTQAIRTYIAGEDGKYSFHALEANTNYELYAEYQHKRSPTRTVSSYDSRTDIPLDLKIPIL